MLAYIDTLHETQRESNLTTAMLQDIPTFDGQDSSKLEDWFIDIDTTTDILTESHTCLAEAKSCGLTHTFIHEVTQTGKYWDEIKGILGLSSAMQTSTLIPQDLLRYHKKTMRLWLPTSITSKQLQSYVLLIITLWQSTFSLKTLGKHPLSHQNYMKGSLNSGWGHQACWEAQHSTPTDSYINSFHSQYDVWSW